MPWPALSKPLLFSLFNANHPIMKDIVVYHVPLLLHRAKSAGMKINATETAPPLILWFL